MNHVAARGILAFCHDVEYLSSSFSFLFFLLLNTLFHDTCRLNLQDTGQPDADHILLSLLLNLFGMVENA